MKHYFVLNSGNSEGPYSVEELMQQAIRRETLVWREGMQTWQKAGAMPELAAYLIPEQTNRWSSDWFRKMSFIVMALIILLLLSTMLFTQINKKNEVSEQEMEQEKRDQLEYEKAYTRKHIEELIHVKNSGYTARFLGGISGLKVTVANSSQFDMDLVLVDITYLKENGGIYKRETLQFNNLKSHTSLTQHAPESKRGTQVESSIVQVKSIEIGL